MVSLYNANDTCKIIYQHCSKQQCETRHTTHREVHKTPLTTCLVTNRCRSVTRKKTIITNENHSAVKSCITFMHDGATAALWKLVNGKLAGECLRPGIHIHTDRRTT